MLTLALGASGDEGRGVVCSRARQPGREAGLALFRSWGGTGVLWASSTEDMGHLLPHHVSEDNLRMSRGTTESKRKCTHVGRLPRLCAHRQF